MANLLLADTVNAPEPLLKAVGIPRQIVVHHQVGALEIDPFTSGVGGNQHPDFRVGTEKGLKFQPFVTVRAAMNGDNGIVAAKHTRDFFMEIIESVAVFAKNNEFAQ